MRILMFLLGSILLLGCRSEEPGPGKELPTGFEDQALRALSYYPELEDVRIKFIVKKAFIPLSSRPYVSSLFRQRENRRYKVVISDKSLDSMDPVLLKNLPYNAQVAIIGHELAHTSQYQEWNSLTVMGAGLLYFIPPFRAWFEKGTDKRTVEHGLGPELLEYAEYVRGQFEFKGQSVSFMDRYYLTPDEIRALMD